MTDGEIRKQVRNILEVIQDCDDSAHSEKVRLTWSSCAAKWCQEIADEMQRRIGSEATDKKHD